LPDLRGQLRLILSRLSVAAVVMIMNMRPILLVKRPLDWLDHLLDHLTTYRLALYYLITLLGWATIVSFWHKTPYTWSSIVVSSVYLALVCWAVNKFLSWLLNIPANKESSLITGLILALILTPVTTGHDYAVLAAAGTAAMASKYLLTLYKSHIFNPAAVGAFISGVAFHSYASWWVGNKFLVPVAVIGGILIARKVKRIQMAALFGAIYFLVLIWTMPTGTSTDAIRHLIWLSLTSTAIIFFATVMLTEPLTSPTKLDRQVYYATLVGLLYSYNRFHLSPEDALLIGNLFTLVVATKRRLVLSFAGSKQEAEGIFSYLFKRPPNFAYEAGQYMEWTLAGKGDDRGNRRYLTMSSAPTEPNMMVSVRMPEQPSAFKQRLSTLKPGDKIMASYLSGSFVLPKKPAVKLAFMAGGVGITPFRSMLKSLVDRQQKRDIILFYSTNKREELAFGDVFTAAKQIGLKSLYAASLSKELVAQNIPDYLERTFYISGPYGYVKSTEDMLIEMGVSPLKTVTDYFPGYS